MTTPVTSGGRRLPEAGWCRRQEHTQLNTQASRHALARRIFHGKRGQLHQPYRQGQEDQLGALGLVLNMVVLWNNVYLDAIVKHLRSQGHPRPR